MRFDAQTYFILLLMTRISISPDLDNQKIIFLDYFALHSKKETYQLYRTIKHSRGIKNLTFSSKLDDVIFKNLIKIILGLSGEFRVLSI